MTPPRQEPTTEQITPLIADSLGPLHIVLQDLMDAHAEPAELCATVHLYCRRMARLIDGILIGHPLPIPSMEPDTHTRHKLHSLN